MKTAQSKLAVVLSVFFILNIISAIVTFRLIDKNKADGTVINLAGKQRMLTQKMSKEVFLLSAGSNTRGALLKTMALFEKTLTGLVHGDKKMGLPVL